jgi:hypothetical protein
MEELIKYKNYILDNEFNDIIVIPEYDGTNEHMQYIAKELSKRYNIDIDVAKRLFDKHIPYFIAKSNILDIGKKLELIYKFVELLIGKVFLKDAEWDEPIADVFLSDYFINDDGKIIYLYVE